MLYRIVRPIAALTLKINFRKIYFSNLELIPEGYPLILAVNHPTAFIEPCVLACFQPHSLNFLVRGDFFAKPVFRRLLESLNMIPIYRLKDGGFTNLKNNYSTFERCYVALKEGKTLMILAEGSCIHEKRLRPIRKGTARIAFGAYDKYGVDNLHIVPIGVNYAHADRFRSDLMMEVGEPLRLKDYLEQYRKEPQSAIKQLTEDLTESLAEKVIIIEKKADEPLTERLFELFRNGQTYRVWPILGNEPHRLTAEKKLADWVNNLEERPKESLKDEVDTYFHTLGENGLTDFGLVQPQHYSYHHSITLIVGFLPFLMGLIGNIIPLVITNAVGNYFVKSIEFRHSVKVASGLGFYLLYLIVLLAFCWHWNSLMGFIMVLLLPMLAYFALLYRELWERWRAGRQVQLASADLIANLRGKRRGLVKIMPV